MDDKPKKNGRFTKSAVKEPKNKRASFENRRVSFDVWITEIPRKQDISQRSLHSVWYNQYELDEIKIENLETIAMMTGAAKVLQLDPVYCRRGLCTENEARRRMKSIENAHLAFFREQELQYKMCLPCVELLAEVCIDSSRESRWDARQQGLKDEVERNKCLRAKLMQHRMMNTVIASAG
jgi:hypothetical protein